MKVYSKNIPDVLLIEPRVFVDCRGFFFESFNAKEFRNETGLDYQFVQDNHSKSHRNVLRGLHYQLEKPQGKLVRVTMGEVFDVAVDLRRSSPYFGKWTGEVLSGENKKIMWIPPGFAHGFLVLSEAADFLYKATEFYMPEHQQCIIWNDPDLNINWPIGANILQSDNDKAGLEFARARVYD